MVGVCTAFDATFTGKIFWTGHLGEFRKGYGDCRPPNVMSNSILGRGVGEGDGIGGTCCSISSCAAGLLATISSKAVYHLDL